MRFSKKRIAGIAALATTVTYALYRRRGTEGTEEALEDTDVQAA